MPIKAVAYYRVAAESDADIELQKKAVLDFAQSRGIEIIHEEADNGVSGLTLNRPGFIKLMDDWIANDKKEFDLIVMRDISRLGRFEDSSILDNFETFLIKHGRRMLFLNGYELPSKTTA